MWHWASNPNPVWEALPFSFRYFERGSLFISHQIWNNADENTFLFHALLQASGCVSLGQRRGRRSHFLQLGSSLQNWGIWALIHFKPSPCFQSDLPSFPHNGFWLLFLGPVPRTGVSLLLSGAATIKHFSMNVVLSQKCSSAVLEWVFYWIPGFDLAGLWWGESVMLCLRSEPQQHFGYWLTEGIAVVWLHSPLQDSFYCRVSCRFAVLG